ncbi:TPA: glycosyltransferase family 2 protein [Photobacterium damselae]
MFSIIIPLYNKYLELEATVKSVVRAFEDYTYEIIIINDGSTDDSLSIAQNLSENNKFINVISKANGGVASARNLGIKLAKYDYIVFLDADDLILPHTAEEYFKLIKSCGSNVGLYCVGFEVLKSNTRFGFDSNKYLKSKDWFGVINDPLKILSLDKNSTFMCASSICVNKKIINDFNISFPLGITHTEDTSFFYDLILVSSVAYSSKICSIYQQDASNRSNLTKPTKSRYIIDKIEHLITGEKISGNDKKYSLAFVAKNYVHLMFNCIEMKDEYYFMVNKNKAKLYFKYMSLYYKCVFLFFIVFPFSVLSKVIK